MTRLVALFITLGLQPETPPCGVLECVSWLAAKTSVTVVEAPSADFIGHWSRGAGLAGTEFYVFPDNTYIYAEWTDLFPLTIYDKGRWQVSGPALILSPDADVKWDPQTDRRFVLLRPQGGSTPAVVGLDRSLRILETLLAREPDQAAGYLRAASLQRKGALTARQAKGIRLRLMRQAWRPSFFESAK